jgi:hypothetical protein
MKPHKSEKSPVQSAWKKERSDERWELRADMLMGKFSYVSVMLPSQITHLKRENEVPVNANPTPDR